MTMFDDVLVRSFAGVVEEATGREMGEAQVQAAMAVGQGEIAIVPDRADALPIASLAAATLAALGSVGSIHLATSSAAEAELIAPLFQKLGFENTVLCAPAEKFVFDSLKGEGTNSKVFTIVIDAEQVLLRDANTPVILAQSAQGGQQEISAESVKKADGLLQKGRDYIVQEETIVIRDSETGKLFPERRFSEGIHAAIQAREGLAVEVGADIIAQTTIADYFRKYTTPAGIAPIADERYQTQYGLSTATY